MHREDKARLKPCRAIVKSCTSISGICNIWWWDLHFEGLGSSYPMALPIATYMAFLLCWFPAAAYLSSADDPILAYPNSWGLHCIFSSLSLLHASAFHHATHRDSNPDIRCLAHRSSFENSEISMTCLSSHSAYVQNKKYLDDSNVYCQTQ